MLMLSGGTIVVVHKTNVSAFAHDLLPLRTTTFPITAETSSLPSHCSMLITRDSAYDEVAFVVKQPGDISS